MKLVSLGFLIAVSVQLISAEIVFPQQQWQTAEPKSQGVDAKKLETAMRYLGDFCGKDGNSQALFIRNGYVLWQGSDVHNKHLVWSCSKSIMSMSFGLLWDDGLIEPDTYAKEHMPELAEYYPEVQLKHLGAMISGVQWQKGKRFVPNKPMHAVGTHYHYNSAQPNALAYICTKVAKQSLQQLFTQRIADPIGMHADMWSWGQQQHPDGTIVNGGSGLPKRGVQMNAVTMARIGWLLANNGMWDGKQIISKRYIDFATQSHWDYKRIKAHNKKDWYRSITGTYGFLFWTNGIRPDGQRMWPHAPANTFALQGNKNNICIVIPEWRAVLVRLGYDQNINCDLYDGVLMTLKDAMDIKPWSDSPDE